MNYWPYIGKLHDAITAIDGETWRDKARKVGVSPQALHRCLIFKQVRPLTAQYISNALGKPVEELFWR